MPFKRHNLDGYGAPQIEWQRVHDAMATDLPQAPDTGGPNRHTAWLTTINPDGTPHVRPLGVIQIDGVWYFNSGPGTRNSRNIATNPWCVVSIATHPFDLVVEGRAERVTDTAELTAVANTFNAQGWPARVEGDALVAEYSAQSAGPPPWHVYRVTPATVHAFGTAEPYGAARFEVS